MKVRTRFAPSPTGYLHIGGLRTALFCYGLSRKEGGQFIVRVEDTDQKRFVEGATEKIFDVLKEYKLEPDESLRHGGEYGPYLQSERKEIYLKYAQELLDKGYAYYCFLTESELETLKATYKGQGFRSPYRSASKEKIQELLDKGNPYVIRLKVPDNEIVEYDDGLQGHIKFDTNIVGDEVLIKSNGMASYHLAVVVDDHLMDISHVFRAIEWLPSTPKQVLLYKYLDWKMPPFYHVPVILDPSGGKLSKRKGAVAAEQFLVDGYLTDAVLNFLMLLGWSAPIERKHGEKEREIFSLEEFVKMFDLKDLNKSNGVFDREKLLWFNKEYIVLKPVEELQTIFINWLEKYAEDKSFLNEIVSDVSLDKKIGLVKERSKTLKEIKEQIVFFFEKPSETDFSIKQLEKVQDKVKPAIEKIVALHEGFSDDASSWTHESWENGMRAIGDDLGIKHGDVFMVLRVAMTGKPFSPPLFECLQLLGKDEVVKRLNYCR